MLQVAADEGGLSRGSLKLGGGTNTIEISRDASPASPKPAVRFRSPGRSIGVEQIQISTDVHNQELQKIGLNQQNNVDDSNLKNELKNALF